MFSSLEMLAGMSLAEEGVLRLVFAAVYLMLNKGGIDNDVSGASRYDSFLMITVNLKYVKVLNRDPCKI